MSGFRLRDELPSLETAGHTSDPLLSLARLAIRSQASVALGFDAKHGAKPLDLLVLRPEFLFHADAASRASLPFFDGSEDRLPDVIEQVRLVAVLEDRQHGPISLPVLEHRVAGVAVQQDRLHRYRWQPRNDLSKLLRDALGVGHVGNDET